MVEINGTFRLRPQLEDMRPCVWCVTPTDTMMKTPGRPDLGAVPLHASCAGLVIFAYRDMQAGRKLDAEAAAGMARLAGYRALGASADSQP